MHLTLFPFQRFSSLNQFRGSDSMNVLVSSAVFNYTGDLPPPPTQ